MYTKKGVIIHRQESQERVWKLIVFEPIIVLKTFITFNSLAITAAMAGYHCPFLQMKLRSREVK